MGQDEGVIYLSHFISLKCFFHYYLNNKTVYSNTNITQISPLECELFTSSLGLTCGVLSASPFLLLLPNTGQTSILKTGAMHACRLKTFFVVILYKRKKNTVFITRNAINIMDILSDKNSANKQWLCRGDCGTLRHGVRMTQAYFRQKLFFDLCAIWSMVPKLNSFHLPPYC